MSKSQPAPGSDNIAALRTELFAALRGLSDKSNPMEIDRARAIADVAQTIINSAKVEVEFIKVAGGKGSGFIPEAIDGAGVSGVIEQRPGVTVRRNVLR